MTIGIDLSWITPHTMGGVEFVTYTLLTAIFQRSKKHTFVIFAAANATLFFTRKFGKWSDVHIHPLPVNSTPVGLRIPWISLFLERHMAQENVTVAFTPNYYLPWFRQRPYLVTIYDLQPLDLPAFFSPVKRLVLRWCAGTAARRATVVFTISQFAADSIVRHFHVPRSRLTVVPCPVSAIASNHRADTTTLHGWKLESRRYFYILSSKLPGKNLDTAVAAFIQFIADHPTAGFKLVISGVSGNQQQHLERQIANCPEIMMTGVVSDHEKIVLLKNATALLFPSIYEGFGIPPVEAMILGTPVLTTRTTAIPEVTRGRCRYVSDPLDVTEWTRAITSLAQKRPIIPAGDKKLFARRYDADRIAARYLNLIEKHARP